MSPQEQWQLGGNAPEIYARYLVPAIFEPWARVLGDFVAIQQGERVLDVACGTGVVARVAAEHVGSTGEVIGVDLNPRMLAVARPLRPPQGVSLRWHAGSAEALPFREASFDVVFCQLGLQYFPNRPLALEEMYRVLIRDGRVALLVWRSIQYSPGFALLADALAEYVSAEAGAIMRVPFSMGEAEALQRLIEDARFQNVEVRPATGIVRFSSPADFVRAQVAGSPLAGPVAEASDAARQALLNYMCHALEPYVGVEGLAFPIAAHMARAKK